MRVISGKAKGRKLKAPKYSGVRPLTDQAKEALFNILGQRVVDSYFLDLFAGSGAVGIEALSRGAKLAIFVERNPKVSRVIRQNLEITGFSDRAEVYVVDVSRALNLLGKKKSLPAGRQAEFDIIFLGAPYESPVLEKALKKLGEIEMLKTEGVIVAEHRKQHALDETYGTLRKFREARYGETVLSFYANSNLSG